MSELRVPTHATAAEIWCRDGRLFTGRLFIPVSSSQHDGPMRVDEWINTGSPFFAFLPDDAKKAFLLNRDQVAVLSVAPPDMDAEETALEEETPSHRIVVEVGDRRLEGEVRIDMPEGHQRVLDYLNRPDRFLLLRTPKQWYLVRKSLIARAVEQES